MLLGFNSFYWFIEFQLKAGTLIYCVIMLTYSVVGSFLAGKNKALILSAPFLGVHLIPAIYKQEFRSAIGKSLHTVYAPAENTTFAII